MSEWKGIESAPRFDLVYVFGRHDDGTGWWNVGYCINEYHWCIAGMDSLEPTHWMPLPAPPVSES